VNSGGGRGGAPRIGINGVGRPSNDLEASREARAEGRLRRVFEKVSDRHVGREAPERNALP